MDYAAATPVLIEVRREMEKYFSKEFYNPNAIYTEGLKVRGELNRYKRKIADIMGSRVEGVIFTSGATEANQIASLSLKRHLDATQLIGYHRLTLESAKCDSITISSPKIYGPKGIGALIVRHGLDLKTSERGTPPMSLIAGFTKALEIAVRDREVERKRLNYLSAKFIEGIEEYRVIQDEPNIINVSVPGILPELLALALEREGVLVSVGRACTSNKPEPEDTPVRFSFGRFTTENEVKEAAKIFCDVVQNLLKLNHATFQSFHHQSQRSDQESS